MTHIIRGSQTSRVEFVDLSSYPFSPFFLLMAFDEHTLPNNAKWEKPLDLFLNDISFPTISCRSAAFIFGMGNCKLFHRITFLHLYFIPLHDQMITTSSSLTANHWNKCWTDLYRKRLYTGVYKKQLFSLLDLFTPKHNNNCNVVTDLFIRNHGTNLIL